MRHALFHIASRADWAAAHERYLPADFARDGFIHCCTAAQVLDVANAYLIGRRDLLLLAIDPARVDSEIRHENLAGGTELFPHIYGPLERAAVVACEPLEPGPDGRFAGTATLSTHAALRS